VNSLVYSANDRGSRVEIGDRSQEISLVCVFKTCGF